MDTSTVELIAKAGQAFFFKTDREDRPVPLDGSNRARLINMRLTRAEKCERCESGENLITRIHSVSNNVARKARRRAVEHWFLKGEGNYEPEWLLRFKPSAGYDSLATISRCRDLVSSLDDAEKEWDTVVEKLGWDENSSQFWDTERNELDEFPMLESATSRQKKLLVDSQHKSSKYKH